MCDKKSIYFISFVGKVDFYAYRNFQAGSRATVALDTNFGILGDTFESSVNHIKFCFRSVILY